MEELRNNTPMFTAHAASIERLKTQTERLGSVKKELSDEERQEYLKAARGFESMFVSMMLKNMRESMLEDPDSKGEDGVGMNFGGGMLQGVADLKFADKVSEGRGLGLAAKVYEYLSGEQMPLQQTIPAPDKLPAIASDGKQDIPSKPTSLTDLQALETAHSRGLAATAVRKNIEISPAVQERLQELQPIVQSAARKYGVPEQLINAVITAESAARTDAVSPAGAKGLMQLMDGTAKDVGVTNPFDAQQNIEGGTRYLRKMLDMFNGDTKLALAGYNAGPGNVQKYDGIPPFRETKNYITQVLRYQREFLASVNNENNL